MQNNNQPTIIPSIRSTSPFERKCKEPLMPWMLSLKELTQWTGGWLFSKVEGTSEKGCLRIFHNFSGRRFKWAYRTPPSTNLKSCLRFKRVWRMQFRILEKGMHLSANCRISEEEGGKTLCWTRIRWTMSLILRWAGRRTYTSFS